MGVKGTVKYISWLVAIPVAIVVVLFAVSNRHDITYHLWPLPFEVSVPQYLPTLVALALGIVLGAAGAWFSGGRLRRKSRQQRHEIKAMQKQLTDAEKNLDVADASLKALPKA
jgi:uncharacterized integral membrane protein